MCDEALTREQGMAAWLSKTPLWELCLGLSHIPEAMRTVGFPRLLSSAKESEMPEEFRWFTAKTL